MTRFEPLTALRVLRNFGVRFVVIGGIAAVAHGSPSITQDLDVCYARDPENLERLADALRSINARLRGGPADVPFRLDARTLAAGDHFTFATDVGDLDCLASPAGVRGFDELDVNAEEMDFDELTVKVAALSDLIRMKRATGRPKDRIDLENLGALRDVLEERRERNG